MTKKATPVTPVKEPLITQVTEEVVTNAIEKPNARKALLAHLNTFKGLKVTDEDSYDFAKKAKKEIQSSRTIGVKIFGAARAGLIAQQKAIVADEKEYVAEIKAIEDPLDAELEAYEEISSAQVREEQATKKLPARIEVLKLQLKLEEVSEELITEMKYLDDTQFQQLIILKKDEQLNARQKAMDEAEERQRQATAAATRATELAAAQEEAAKTALADAEQKIRYRTMLGLGFQLFQGNYFYGDFKVQENYVKALTEVEFEAAVGNYTSKINEIKAETARVKAAADAQKIVDDAAKKAKEEQEEVARKEALKPEKEILMSFVATLGCLQLPQVKTEAGKLIIARARQCIDATCTDLTARINSL